VSEFDATYYDGRSSARTVVRVRARGGRLQLAAADGNFDAPLLDVALGEVRADARVGSARRLLALPGGAQLQTDDHDAVAVLFPDKNGLQARVLGLERSWGYALAAVAIIGVFTWWCVVYGLPVAARLAAMTVPVNFESKLGEQALYTIDKALCGPSALEEQRRAAVQKEFERVVAGLNDGFLYRLELRACPRMGPNALALPGGTVLVTDDLASLAADDAQLTAVLAHEIGHVRQRHGLRLGLQGAGLAAIIAALAGDAVSLAGLATALPTALLQAGYSRSFEEEADEYALQRLREIGVPGKHLADILSLLAKERGQPGTSGGALDYLSTHPAVSRRIERALK
jgi:Zn-dependent protease with chaperone function